MATNRRFLLQKLLEELLGSKEVYFQPPESTKMTYPAIRYELDNIDNTHADDGVYRSEKRYAITLIDRNSDSEYVDKLAHLPGCRFDRHYKSNNLNHYIFSIYY